MPPSSSRLKRALLFSVLGWGVLSAGCGGLDSGRAEPTDPPPFAGWPDPGPTAIDCGADDELELSLIADFETGGDRWVIYNDSVPCNDPDALPECIDRPWYQPNQLPARGLLRAERIPEGRCGSEYAVHIQAGPFLDWGGGFSKDFIRFDASGYRGVAFWARMGPESQNQLLVAAGDYHVNRLGACDYPDELGATVCLPDVRLASKEQLGPDGLPLRDAKTNEPLPPIETPGRCLEGFGRIVKTLETAPSKLACGDNFNRYVQLSTEWQFFTVPFGDMRQTGYAFQPSAFDTSELWSVSFNYNLDVVDIWVDDVSFYR